MAKNQPIVVEQGSTHVEINYVKVLTNNQLEFNATTNPYIPLNLTGYTARLHVRKTFDSNSTVLDLGSSVEIILGTTDGKITITIPPALTNAIIFAGERATYYYDLLITGAGTSTRVVEGTFTIKRAITRL